MTKKIHPLEAITSKVTASLHEIISLKKEIVSLEETVSSLQKETSALKKEIASQKKEIALLKQTVGEKEKIIQKTGAQNEALASELADLKSASARLEADRHATGTTNNE